MATTKTQRIVSMVLVVFVLGSSIGGIIYYVSQNKQQAKENQQLQDLQNQLNNQKPNETVLQGTPLQNFTPLNSIPALQAVDLAEGSGDAVKAGATITVNYTGAVASTGTIFQSSYDSGKTATFGLDEVIPGWTQGIPGMKVGGTRRLLIPASLAYAANPPSGSGIPVNADLVFDVTLVSIN
jgi:FKBP-type peptidyl-prolyl cis-trans isomerase